jgi:RNA polymerase sigma-70 factor (ECF subfamily)
VRRNGASPGDIEGLYRQRFPHFVRVAAGICGSAEIGHDVVQNAFISAIRTRRLFRGDGPLEAWVWRIVVNEARRAVKRARVVSLEQTETASPNGHGNHEIDPHGVRAWIAALPERQREAIFLRYFADLDYRAIADVLDIEVSTVSATLGAAHRTLRKRLTEVRR